MIHGRVRLGWGWRWVRHRLIHRDDLREHTMLVLVRGGDDTVRLDGAAAGIKCL